MRVELGLGDPDGLGKIIVGQRRVDDFVAVIDQVGRFDAAGNRTPAVEEEDFHGDIVSASDGYPQARNDLLIDQPVQFLGESTIYQAVPEPEKPMKPDWTQVGVEHVRQACADHDAGTVVPKRAAKSTFLIFNGKTYPAKFIRGLAFRLATGVELDPSRDYSGGLETIKFFQGLGLSTRHDSTGEPKQIELDVTPQMFASVRKGRMTVPLGEKPGLAQVAGLPWCSIATLQANGEKLHRVVGPAIVQTNQWALAIMFIEPATDLAEYEGEARTLRRRLGLRPNSA